ncbi:substrate-binding domain-containing protein [Gilliamella apicola]|uniref:substrate-binding domain-containing protein n=1 Tax=Gilliamella apicola TaxID=1196095 RepID=UPI0015563B4A|nr:substrate-binding domain-containing protein [Gilliamella apicola]
MYFILIQYLLLNNTIDVFIGYANYAPVIQQNSQLTIIDIPNHLLPTIEYSIALLNPTNIMAKLFIYFVQNKQAQECLLKYGFS